MAKKGTPLGLRPKKDTQQLTLCRAELKMRRISFFGPKPRGVPFCSIRVELYPFLPLNCTLFWPKTYSLL